MAAATRTDGPEELDSELLAAGPSTLDGLPVRAPMVVDEYEESAVLWQVDLLGNPCGAWVFPYDGAKTSRKLLALCDRRALIAVDPSGPAKLLASWANACGVQVDHSLDDRICSIPSLLESTVSARATYAAAVQEEERRGNKRLAPLTWTGRLTHPVATTAEELFAAGSIQMPPEPVESANARATVRLTAWAIGLWRETESLRVRRPYLRTQFGPEQPLPQSWRSALLAAYRSDFDLT
jgi:hypothetical protein